MQDWRLRLSGDCIDVEGSCGLDMDDCEVEGRDQDGKDWIDVNGPTPVGLSVFDMDKFEVGWLEALDLERPDIERCDVEGLDGLDADELEAEGCDVVCLDGWDVDGAEVECEGDDVDVDGPEWEGLNVLDMGGWETEECDVEGLDWVRAVGPGWEWLPVADVDEPGVDLGTDVLDVDGCKVDVLGGFEEECLDELAADGLEVELRDVFVLDE